MNKIFQSFDRKHFSTRYCTDHKLHYMEICPECAIELKKQAKLKLTGVKK